MLALHNEEFSVPVYSGMTLSYNTDSNLPHTENVEDKNRSLHTRPVYQNLTIKSTTCWWSESGIKPV